jgi:hypothetical protein
MAMRTIPKHRMRLVGYYHQFLVVFTSWQTSFQKYSSGNLLFQDLQWNFQEKTSVDFFGKFEMKEDPLVSQKECVRMMAYETWKATGYRFVYVHCFLLTQRLPTMQKCTG